MAVNQITSLPGLSEAVVFLNGQFSYLLIEEKVNSKVLWVLSLHNKCQENLFCN